MPVKEGFTKYLMEGFENTFVQTINNKFPNDNQVGKRFNYTIENGIQNVDFVIDMDGNLYIGRGHSYLSGGGSV